jgi:hypothetical protein
MDRCDLHHPCLLDRLPEWRSLHGTKHVHLRRRLDGLKLRCSGLQPLL